MGIEFISNLLYNSPITRFNKSTTLNVIHFYYYVVFIGKTVKRKR
jgi:hypothetical protein